VEEALEALAREARGEIVSVVDLVDATAERVVQGVDEHGGGARPEDHRVEPLDCEVEVCHGARAVEGLADERADFWEFALEFGIHCGMRPNGEGEGLALAEGQGEACGTADKQGVAHRLFVQFQEVRTGREDHPTFLREGSGGGSEELGLA
jgi:hypothetical protein